MIETRTHARLAPSAASRWMACPGSVRLSESVVDAGSDDADRGTACHAMLERCLKQGWTPQQFAGKKITVGENGRHSEIEVTTEMIGWVKECLDWIVAYLKSHPGSHLRSEERLVVGRAFGCPDDVWGTADVLIVNTEELVVDDAKFGYNEVAVVDNPQLILYAIGAAADYGFIHEKYRLVISQPQCGEPKEHVLTRAELIDYQQRYAPKIAATRDPDAPLTPSDVACRWCPAAGVCPELQKHAITLAQREFVNIETLPVEDLATLLRHADRIKAGLEAAQRHAVRLIQCGGKVPGFKVVAGDKRRVWKDEARAVDLLRTLGYHENDFTPRKMITPAQAETLVGKKTKKALSPFIEKPKGDATLAPEDDPRESLMPDFTPIDDETAASVDDLL